MVFIAFVRLLQLLNLSLRERCKSCVYWKCH